MPHHKNWATLDEIDSPILIAVSFVALVSVKVVTSGLVTK